MVCGVTCDVACLCVCVYACVCVFLACVSVLCVVYCVMVHGVFVCFVFACNVRRDVLLYVFCDVFNVCVRGCYCLACEGDVVVIYSVRLCGLLCVLGISVRVCVVMWLRKVVVC